MTYWNQAVSWLLWRVSVHEVSVEKMKYLMFWFCSFRLQFISWYFLLGGERTSLLLSFLLPFGSLWRLIPCYVEVHADIRKNCAWVNKNIKNGTWTEEFYMCLNFNNYCILQQSLKFFHGIAMMWHGTSNLWKTGKFLQRFSLDAFQKCRSSLYQEFWYVWFDLLLLLTFLQNTFGENQ